jgi:hypothetical protein
MALGMFTVVVDIRAEWRGYFGVDLRVGLYLCLLLCHAWPYSNCA